MSYKIIGPGELKTFTDQTADALLMPVDPEDIADVTAKINLLTMLLGSSCHAMALAQRVYDRKMLDLMTEAQYSKWPHYEKKLVFDGHARFDAYYVKLTTEQNSAIKFTLNSLEAMLYRRPREY